MFVAVQTARCSSVRSTVGAGKSCIHRYSVHGFAVLAVQIVGIAEERSVTFLHYLHHIAFFDLSGKEYCDVFFQPTNSLKTRLSAVIIIQQGPGLTRGDTLP
jgi:hypothetical protein